MIRTDWKTRARLTTPIMTVLVVACALVSKAEEIRSRDGQLAVRLDPASDRSIVYAVADGAERYSIPNLAGRLFLSEDGSHTATCHHWLGADPRPQDVVVQFYRSGSPVARLTLGELGELSQELPQDGPFQRWGLCGGFTGTSKFSLETADGRRIDFDLASGERWETGSPHPVASPSDVLSVSSYQPDAFCAQAPTPLFCDDFAEGRKQGWDQVRGQWLLRDQLALQATVFPEHVLGQRSAEPDEGNLLFFYNQSFSDVDIRTLVRLDVDPSRGLKPSAGAGIVFRFQNEENYYMFRLGGEEGAVLGKVFEGKWIQLVEPKTMRLLGRKLRYSENLYGLRVRTQGERIQCWLYEWPKDGRPGAEQALVHELEYPDTGLVGRAGLVTFETRADFLYFRVDEF